MSEEINTPAPVRFNPMKHHRNYILHVLSNVPPDKIVSLLDQVCNNYNDIYTGELSAADIAKEIIVILKKKNVFSREDFTRWLKSNNGYQKLILADSSQWILRLGNEKERYIHLHPSRNGQLTERFKGSSLKTVFLLKALQKDPYSLENVNRVRTQINLSPVKNLDRNKGILNCYETFFSK